MNTKDLISHKQDLLEAARAKVAQYEREIEMLRSMEQDDEFDVALASKIGKGKPQTVVEVSSLDTNGVLVLPPSQTNTPLPHGGTAAQPIAPHADAAIQATPSGRNPKGTVDSVLLAILLDGNEWSLSPLLDELNKHLPNKKRLGSLRGRLMNLKQQGRVISRKPGLFQIAPKENDPVGAGS